MLVHIMASLKPLTGYYQRKVKGIGYASGVRWCSDVIRMY